MNKKLPIYREDNTSGLNGTVGIVSLGCAKNRVDSEIILGDLDKKGLSHTEELESADVIVVNTCGFLKSAVEEGLEKVLELSELKKTGKCKKLIVAGCMVERYRDQLKAELPEVDQFIGTDGLLEIEPIEKVESQLSSTTPWVVFDHENPRALSTPGGFAYLKIAEGCDRPCTFCIIPKLRGSFRSREIESLAIEAEELLERGVKEINLIGQDLTAYGIDRGRKPELIKLLHELDGLGGSNDFWLRLLYAYPIGVSTELLELLEANNSICSYLDMPLQHISGPVLKKMKRPLGEKGTRSLIETISGNHPSIALRTTLITGFPGETKEDFNRLLNFISEGHFLHIGIFTYSDEEEAESFDFNDRVEEHVKHERKEQLLIAQQEVVNQKLEREVGKTVRVLIEGEHEESELLLKGRTEHQAPEVDGRVIINDLPEDLLGKPLSGVFGDVEITEVAGYDLVGHVVSTD